MADPNLRERTFADSAQLADERVRDHLHIVAVDRMRSLDFNATPDA